MKLTSLIAPLALFAVSSVALADDCSINLDSNDQMQFSTKSIEVSKKCENFTINLNHTGKLAKNIMGHNVVISTAADMRGVATDGMSAGLENKYVKPGDSRVLAVSEVIGGGESTSFSFPVSALKDGESYVFFCSFPGHVGIMQGSLTVAL